MRYDICVLGLGYIGLPTASIFATKGKRVLGVDISENIVGIINRGEIHIEEPDLDVLVRAAVQSGNLTADTNPDRADTFIIAVPTPIRHSDDGRKIPDLSYIEKATEAIAKVIENDALVIVESTIPVGTTEKVRDWMRAMIVEIRKDVNPDSIQYAHCPERVLPGQMLKELVSNARISGGLTSGASLAAKELYETFCTAPIYLTNARTAEMAKLTENASRDVSIAFANELSLICDRLDIDVWELIELANHHPRVNILQPGPGVGGHCIAVDPWFIVDAAFEESRLIQTARLVNDCKPQWVVEQVMRKAERFNDPVIACLGLAFKANVDDLRESPAMDIAVKLAESSGWKVIVAEPNLKRLPDRLTGKTQLLDATEAIKRADIVVLLVDHRQFKEIPKAVLQDKVVIDTKGIWR